MKTLAGLLVTGLIISSCTGNSSASAKFTGANHGTAAENNVVSFKVNGTQVRTSGWNISRFIFKKTGAIHLAISSNMHQDTRTIKANIGGITPGSYNFSEDAAATTYGHYYPDFDKDIFDNYGFVSGAFTLSSVDTVQHVVNASFAGKVKNRKGKTFDITEGKIINGKLKAAMETF